MILNSAVFFEGRGGLGRLEIGPKTCVGGDCELGSKRVSAMCSSVKECLAPPVDLISKSALSLAAPNTSPST